MSKLRVVPSAAYNSLLKKVKLKTESATDRWIVIEMTLKIPEELASRLRPLEDELPRILEMGLREFETTRQSGFGGFADVIERLADLPTPEEVLALRPSAALQARLSALLEKNRTDGLSSEEEHEWAAYGYLEHIVRLAKASAALKLKAA